MQILLVDDEESFLALSEEFLKDMDSLFEVDTSDSAKKGLKILEEEEYDAVVSDYQMPEMDGLEFLRILRRERNDDVPFIMFTGKGREEVAIEALNLGADRYLQKGGDPSSQYGVLARAIKQEVKHKLTEKEKERARKEWRITFDALPDIAALISPDHKILRINKKGAEAMGMDPDDLIGKKCYEIVHNRQSPIPQCPCKRSCNIGGPVSGEEFEEHGRHYIAAASPIFDENGEIEALAHTVKDITRRKETEDRFRESSEKLRTIFESVDDAIIVTDLEGNVIEANQAAAEMVGLENVEEYMEHNAFEFVHPEDRHIAERAARKTFEEGRVQKKKEYRILTIDGEVIHILTSTGLLLDDEGEPSATVNIIKDITERKEMEEALRYNVDRFRTLIENISDVIVSMDDEGIIRYASPSVEGVLGYDPETLIGEPYSRFIRERDRETTKSKFQQAKEGSEALTTTLEVRHRDGSWRTMEITGRSKKSGSRADEVIITMRDITEREKMEEKYRTVFENTGTATMIIEEDATLSLVNREFEELSGYSKDEIEGKMSWTDFVPEKYLARMKKYHESRRERGEAPRRYEFDFIDREGNLKRGFLTIDIIPGTKKSVASLLDITERKEMEESLRERKEEQEKLLDSVDTQIWFATDAETCGLVNRARADFLGMEKEDIMGKDYWDVWENDEEARICIEGNRKVFDSGESLRRIEWITTFKGEKKAVEVTKIPVTDESGNIKSLACTGHDVTERMRLQEEEEFLHSLLRHDMRNAAQIIQGYLELTQDLDLPQEAEKYISKARMANQKEMEIVEMVNTLKRRDEEETREVDLVPIIHEGLERWSSQAEEEGMEIVEKCPSEGCSVEGSPLLERVFHNLIENSIHHSGGTTIRISGEIESDEMICTVEDDGRGIPDEDKGIVFERGFITDEKRGSGLGLFLVKRLLKSYGGNIEVKDSALGGARFDIRLKRV